MAELVAVSVESVSKAFRRHSEPAKTLKERLLTWHRSEVETFDALRDVSFSINAGTSVGILGHNGSGKSTLLKTIAGTIRPSSGVVRIRGRLAALLELGAGFHPDLTGSENIYLNGSVLGFSKSKIDEIFDDVVRFAELEDFIHTQVKHYSSGMYARLGFAVAINVDPDVLLVDEVLSVGDEAFQRKCMARIGEYQAQGKSLMLVTHSPEQVIEVCDRAIVLDHGKIIFDGDPHEAAGAYRRSIHGPEGIEDASAGQVPVSQLAIDVTGCSISSGDDATASTGEPLEVKLDIHVSRPIESQCRVIVGDKDNVELLNLSSFGMARQLFSFQTGPNKLKLGIHRLNLAAGSYWVTVIFSDGSSDEIHGVAERVGKFTVTNKGVDTGRTWVEASFSYVS